MESQHVADLQHLKEKEESDELKFQQSLVSQESTQTACNVHGPTIVLVVVIVSLCVSHDK